MPLMQNKLMKIFIYIIATISSFTFLTVRYDSLPKHKTHSNLPHHQESKSSLLERSKKNSQTFYITRSGSKYHKSNCSYLKYSSSSLELSDAVKKGYTPCSRCRPSSSASSSINTRYSTPNNNNNNNHQSVNTYNTRMSYAVQCTGTTQKGRRCRNRTKNASQRCHHHG